MRSLNQHTKKLKQKLSQIDWLNFHSFDRFSARHFVSRKIICTRRTVNHSLWLDYILRRAKFPVDVR